MADRDPKLNPAAGDVFLPNKKPGWGGVVEEVEVLAVVGKLVCLGWLGTIAWKKRHDFDVWARDVSFVRSQSVTAECAAGMCEACECENSCACECHFDDSVPEPDWDEWDEEFCRKCGKALEDFSDFGCEECDVRWPEE